MDLRSQTGLRSRSFFGITLEWRFVCLVPMSVIIFTLVLPQDSQMCTWHGLRPILQEFYLDLTNCLFRFLKALRTFCSSSFLVFYAATYRYSYEMTSYFKVPSKSATSAN